jgi:hypothetical protein
VSKHRQDDSRYQAWLKRTRRRLAGSGGLSQMALQLAMETGHEPGHWQKRLAAMLDGSEVPSIDLIIRIDSILSKPASHTVNDLAQELLFACDDPETSA